MSYSMYATFTELVRIFFTNALQTDKPTDGHSLYRDVRTHLNICTVCYMCEARYVVDRRQMDNLSIWTGTMIIESRSLAKCCGQTD